MWSMVYYVSVVIIRSLCVYTCTCLHVIGICVTTGISHGLMVYMCIYIAKGGEINLI